ARTIAANAKGRMKRPIESALSAARAASARPTTHRRAEGHARLSTGGVDSADPWSWRRDSAYNSTLTTAIRIPTTNQGTGSKPPHSKLVWPEPRVTGPEGHGR